MEEDGDAEKSTLEHGEWRYRRGCRKKYMSPLEHGEWRDRKGCRIQKYYYIRIQKYIISWRMENEEEGAEKIQKYMSTLGHRRGWSMRMSRQTNPIICEQKPKTCLQKDVGEDIWGG